MSEEHLVFTYGTLKRKERNTDVLATPKNGTAVFCGTGRTVKKYPLVVASKYFVPCLLRREGEGKNVKGEIFKVDDSMLASLDDCEGHPDFYHREQVDIFVTEDSNDQPLNSPTVQLCWVYLIPRFRKELMEYPMIDEFHCEETEHVPFAERLHRREEVKNSILPD